MASTPPPRGGYLAAFGKGFMGAMADVAGMSLKQQMLLENQKKLLRMKEELKQEFGTPTIKEIVKGGDGYVAVMQNTDGSVASQKLNIPAYEDPQDKVKLFNTGKGVITATWDDKTQTYVLSPAEGAGVDEPFDRNAAGDRAIANILGGSSPLTDSNAAGFLNVYGPPLTDSINALTKLGEENGIDWEPSDLLPAAQQVLRLYRERLGANKEDPTNEEMLEAMKPQIEKLYEKYSQKPAPKDDGEWKLLSPSTWFGGGGKKPDEGEVGDTDTDDASAIGNKRVSENLAQRHITADTIEGLSAFEADPTSGTHLGKIRDPNDRTKRVDVYAFDLGNGYEARRISDGDLTLYFKKGDQ